MEEIIRDITGARRKQVSRMQLAGTRALHKYLRVAEVSLTNRIMYVADHWPAASSSS